MSCTHIHNIHTSLCWAPVTPLLSQLMSFKEDNAGQLDSASTALEQALEQTKANMNWVALNKEQVLEWLKSEVSSTAWEWPAVAQ